jgi:hypothetical protein
MRCQLPDDADATESRIGDTITAMPKKPAKAEAGPGPKAEMFKIEDMGWEDAVKKALTKKKPAGGWPR